MAAGPIEKTLREPTAFGVRQWSGVVLGPLFLLACLILPPPEGLTEPGWRALGVAVVMAVFWVSECIPIAVTALLPLVLFPLLGIASTKAAAAPYANPLIFLFLGGFMLALALQRWGLHLRVALNLLSVCGTRPRGIILGMLLASALISMWVSNTATSVMMLPIALSILAIAPDDGEPARGFAPALLLAVAYGCTIGGVATLIGTPPNALLAAYLADSLDLEIGFGQWMVLGLPITAVGLVIGYIVLTRVAFRVPATPVDGLSELIAAKREALGPWGRGERGVAVVFAVTAVLWITRPWLDTLIPLLSDTTIAIGAVLALFMIPVQFDRGVFLMDVSGLKQLPWDVLLLFGGGLALASVIDQHGVSGWLGGGLESFSSAPSWVFVAIMALGILFLTELTSNTATTATFLPVAGAIALATGRMPIELLVPTALAASCAFMMPVGTPPNAVVFGSGRLSLMQMVKAGLWMNLCFIPLIVIAALWLAPLVL